MHARIHNGLCGRLHAGHGTILPAYCSLILKQVVCNWIEALLESTIRPNFRPVHEDWFVFGRCELLVMMMTMQNEFWQQSES